jgi:hypothetical protein
MKNGVRCKHFGDRRAIAIVPYILEPASWQISIRVSHIHPHMVVYANCDYPHQTVDCSSHSKRV